LACNRRTCSAGRPSPAGPQYDLLEARRLVEQGDAKAAIPTLVALEEGLTPSDQLVRLRYLAAAYNLTGEAKLAFPLLERAQRMAELLGDKAEMVRIKSVLAATLREDVRVRGRGEGPARGRSGV